MPYGFGGRFSKKSRVIERILDYAECQKLLGKEEAKILRSPNVCLFRRPHGIAVRYCLTDVITFYPNGDIKLNTDGWYTKSTRYIIDHYQSALTVGNHKGRWYVNAYGNSYWFDGALTFSGTKATDDRGHEIHPSIFAVIEEKFSTKLKSLDQVRQFIKAMDWKGLKSLFKSEPLAKVFVIQYCDVKFLPLWAGYPFPKWSEYPAIVNRRLMEGPTNERNRDQTHPDLCPATA
jgi:hypothetical protein